MITKEKVEKIVHDLNGLLEKSAIAERTANDKNSKDFKGYVWMEVYNAVGESLAAELSCKLLACIIDDMARGNFMINCVESLENSLRKMADTLDNELKVRQANFEAEILIGNMDFKCF